MDSTATTNKMLFLNISSLILFALNEHVQTYIDNTIGNSAYKKP